MSDLPFARGPGAFQHALEAALARQLPSMLAPVELSDFSRAPVRMRCFKLHHSTHLFFSERIPMAVRATTFLVYPVFRLTSHSRHSSPKFPQLIAFIANSILRSIFWVSFHGILRHSPMSFLPKSVTHVLNHLCYLCIEPEPITGLSLLKRIETVKVTSHGDSSSL